MTGINSFNAGSVSAMFSSLGNASNTGNTGMFGSFDYTTYSSIKTGSYKKLLKAYYANEEKAEGSSTDGTGAADSASKQKTNATSVRDNAKDVTESIEALNDRDLWEKKSVKAEDGTTKQEYDKDAIYKVVSQFVQDYNTLVGSTGNSSDQSVLRSAANMVNYVKANKAVLEKAGISIGEGNKLAVDEEVFKESDMSTAKSLFTGAGSFGKSVAGNASMIYGSAVAQLSKLASTNLYSNDGTYTYMTGSNYSRYL